MSSQLQSNNPTSYMGVLAVQPRNVYIRSGPVWGRAPLPSDCRNYTLGDTWLWVEGAGIWQLTRKTNVPGGGQLATWTTTSGAGAAGIQTITGNVGVAIGGAAVNIVGDGAFLSGVTTNFIAANTLGISVQDAVADGATKGVSTYSAAQFTTAAGVVSINDATVAAKGIASFDPASFTVAAGAVSINNATAITRGIASFNPLNFTVLAGAVSLTGISSFSWLPVVGVVQLLAPNAGYYTTNAAPTAFTLPAIAAAGSIIKIQGASGGGWTISQALGQQVIFTSTVATSAGAGARVASSSARDGLELLCITANTNWQALNIKGNPLVT